MLPPELAEQPPLPSLVAYLWDYFLELHQARQNNGFGPSAIQYLDIDAWSRLTKRSLDAWELKAILDLDRLFLASIPKPKG